jgi:glycogen(starch) synthase
VRPREMPILKVGLFSPHYPTIAGEGGIGTYTRTLAEALAGLGQSAHVLTLGTASMQGFAGEIPVDVIPRQYFPVVDRLLPGATACWRIGEKAAQLTRSRGLELFEFPNWEGLGLWFALRRSIPLVVRLHTSSAETQEIDGLPSTWRLKCDIRRERMQVYRADALVTHSDAHRQRMAAELSIDPERIVVIPHGISLYPRFIRDQTEKSETTVLFLGRLERRKGALDLLKAIPMVLSAVPKTRFLLIGRDRAHCPGGRTHQEYADDEFPAGIRRQITFAGTLDDEEVTRHMQTADLFVAPSLYESFGLVFLEAMRWGTPVVGTRAGGIPEIIKHGESGLLVPPGDPAELAAAIVSLLNDREARRRLGESGRRRVEEEFSARTMAMRTLDFYSSVVSSYAIHRT